MAERYTQGTALKNDVTRYELRLSSLKYERQAICNSVSVLNANLVTLLGLDVAATVVPMAGEDMFLPTSEAYWQEHTATFSSDLKAIDKSRQMAETGLRLERAGRLHSVGTLRAI